MKDCFKPIFVVTELHKAFDDLKFEDCTESGEVLEAELNVLVGFGISHFSSFLLSANARHLREKQLQFINKQQL